MSKFIDRLKILFLILFAIGAVGAWTYQILWVGPAKACDKAQAWWDASSRTCATPLYIPSLTGRPAGMSREEWSKVQAARELKNERLGPGAAGAVPAPGDGAVTKAGPAEKAATPAAATPKAAAAPPEKK